VARAYRELEADGIVVSRVRHGTTVAALAPAAAEPALQERLREEARRYAAAIWRLGASPEQALDAVREQLSRGSA
jgi:GntR family transcriptional regulator